MIGTHTDDVIRLWRRLISASWRIFGLFFLILSVLFIISFIPIDLTAFLTNLLERYGDLLGFLWKISTGLASLISLGIAILKFRGASSSDDDRRSSTGPAQALAIHSNEGVINITLKLGNEAILEDAEQESDDEGGH